MPDMADRELVDSETRTAVLIGILDEAADMQLYIEQMARRGYCPAGWPDNMRTKIHNVMRFLADELSQCQERNSQLLAELPTADNVIPLRKAASR